MKINKTQRRLFIFFFCLAMFGFSDLDVQQEEQPLRKITITIRTLTGKTYKIETTPSELVSELKKLIEDQEGIPSDQQRLLFTKETLEDNPPLFDLENDHTLRSYNIKDGSKIHLVLRLLDVPQKNQPLGKIETAVHVPGRLSTCPGRFMYLEIDANTTVSMIKDKFSKTTRIPEGKKLRLTYKGVVRSNNDILAKYEIGDSTPIYLTYTNVAPPTTVVITEKPKETKPFPLLFTITAAAVIASAGTVYGLHSLGQKVKKLERNLWNTMKNYAKKLDSTINTERPIDEVFNELIEKAKKQNKNNIVKKLKQKWEEIKRARWKHKISVHNSVYAAIIVGGIGGTLLSKYI